MNDWSCTVQKLHTPEEVEEDFIIVIDVIRAFTTAAFAFAGGAEKIILVSTVEEAFSLKRRNPDYLQMGEVGGLPIDGFNFGNSPIELEKADLKGKTLVQRTSAGTQGVVRSFKSKRILTSSFVVAEATLKRIRYLKPQRVTCVITGAKNGDEDRALADYLEECLRKGKADPTKYLKRVELSPEGQIHASSHFPHFPKEDLEAVLKLNAFEFSMEISKEDGLPVLRATSFDGTLWKERT